MNRHKDDLKAEVVRLREFIRTRCDHHPLCRGRSLGIEACNCGIREMLAPGRKGRDAPWDEVVALAAKPARPRFQANPTIAKWIEHWEGRRHRAYVDTTGHVTTGVGLNLERQDAPQRLAAVGASHSNVLAGVQTLSDEQVDRLLDMDVADAILAVNALVAKPLRLGQARHTALVDMAFNLGHKGLSKFAGMLSAVDAGDWQTAAKEALDSKWATQVGRRAAADAKALRDDVLDMEDKETT